MPKGGRRVGAGRPRIMNESRNFTVRVPLDLIEAAHAAGEAEGVGLSEVVRAALTRLVERAKRKSRKKTAAGGKQWQR